MKKRLVMFAIALAATLLTATQVSRVEPMKAAIPPWCPPFCGK
jgi:hypothetical protein